MNIMVHFISLYDIENKKKMFSDPMINIVDYGIEEFESFYQRVSVKDNMEEMYNDAYREFRDRLPYDKTEFSTLIDIDKISLKGFVIFINASVTNPISTDTVKKLLPGVNYNNIQTKYRTIRVVELFFNIGARKILMYDGYDSDVNIFNNSNLIPFMKSDKNPDIEMHSKEDTISFIDEYGFWNQGIIREVSSYPSRTYGIMDIKNEYHLCIHHDMILNVYDDSCEEFKNERQLILDSIAI